MIVEAARSSSRAAVALAIALTAWRLYAGPTLTDRVVVLVSRTPRDEEPGLVRLLEAIDDVLQAALSEIEEYTRVTVHHMDHAKVHGSVAADLPQDSERQLLIAERCGDARGDCGR